MAALNTKIRTYAQANEQAVLADTGSIIGALSLSGVEASLLSQPDKIRLTKLLRNVIQRLPFDADISQYYFHFDCDDIPFKERQHPRARLVSERRKKFLLEKRVMSHL